MKVSRNSSNTPVLLLQGPVGPFFSILQRKLMSNGYPVTRISFNAADRLFISKDLCKIDFSGNLKDWEIQFQKFLDTKKIKCVILFGADRPIHQIARNICLKNDIKVFCLEEGYFRPGFITFELGGNNASSPLANKLPPNDFIYENEKSEFKEAKKFSNSIFKNKSFYGFIYYFFRECFTIRAQRQLYHKQINLLTQAFFWIKNYLIWLKNSKADKRLLEKLSKKQFFMVALQLDSDMQTRFHSNGWKKNDIIKEVVESFANSSNKSSYLVFKVHPLERGHMAHDKLITDISKNFDISHRIFVLQTGSIGHWLKYASGVIAVNSSSCFSAIYHGCKILLLGNAIFDHECIVTKYEKKSDLDSFWSKEYSYNKSFSHNYLGWVKQNACLKGDFYEIELINIACEEIILKLSMSF